jgi:hypothetical protein
MGLRDRTNLVENQFFSVTTSIVKHARLFIKDLYCNILINNSKHYQDIYHFVILGYVIMPSHLHWILQTEPKHYEK